MTRKTFLQTSGAAALGLLLPGSAKAHPIDSESLPDLAPANLPSGDELYKWLHQLADWCPAYTGSPGHVKFVDFLDQKLREAKLVPQRKTFTLPYWELKNYSIELNGEKIHAASYRPYCGIGDLTAPLYFAGTGSKLDYSGANGKIVLIEMPPAPDANADEVKGELIGTYPANLPHRNVRTGVIGVYRFTPDIKAAEKAGAAGVIYIWNSISDGNAEDQALPFSSPNTNVPVLWVNHTVGERLKQAAGANIRMSVNATVHPDTPTDNLWAILPGKTEEAIIINTHTDGCNACEENGGLGVVALAKHFAKVPLSQRNRTLVFLMTTGHFGHGYVHGTEDWRKSNPALMKKAVACVTIEHLAATEWVDHPASNEYKASGELEWGLCYTPKRVEGELFLKAVTGTEAKKTFAYRPDGAYPGEGAGFWAAGIPTVSYIPTPQYLFIAPAKGGGVDKLDKHRLHGEVVTFARVVAMLDKMPAGEIKGT